MAVDKLVDSAQLDADLTSVANAIRAKTGGSGALSLPSGLASAVEAIQRTGKDFVSGTFTVPNDAETYRINFGKSFSRYLFIIEMTDDSKTTLINSGSSNSLTFLYFGIYPAPAFQKQGTPLDAPYGHFRYRASSPSLTGTYSVYPKTKDETYIENAVAPIESGHFYKFLAGYSYNYVVISLD